MDIVVCMKQVVDLQHIRIRRETREPVLEGLPLVFGDFEKNALEEALRIKEKHSGKVIVVSVGSQKLRDTVIEALAMGADEAVIITDPELEGSDTMGSARVLAKAIRKIGNFDIILLGEGSADNYSGQVTSRLAEILDLPQITYARELQVVGKAIRAVRDLEESLEVVEAQTPLLVSVTSEINKPRLPTLPQILKAARKPIREWKSSDIGVLPTEAGYKASSLRVLSNLAPEQERKGIFFDGDPREAVENLIKSLQKEGAL